MRMKRLAAYFLLTCMIFCFVSCKSEKSAPKATKATKATTAATTQKPETTAPTKASTAATTAATEAPTEKKTSEGNIVIVLDPGHDAACPRNHPQLGVNEQDLDLAIGLACRDRLNQYEGVTVYMTREDGTCPNAAGKYETVGDYDACIMARTKFGTEKNADLFISLHCNASTGELNDGANGAEVYVSNYPEYYNKFKPLGELVLNNITSRLDISSRGVLTRTNEEKGCYEDGTVKDFYYLISNSVDDGHPGMIIEHAFMDNNHDNEILKNENNLKILGEADADAIAEFYGLKLKQ